MNALRSLSMLLLLTLLGCARSEEPLVVFAASSLREAFTELGDGYEKAHPSLRISFQFAGTQTLRHQLEEGAEVDVFASADLEHMEALKSRGLVAEPSIFAKNELVLVVSEEAKDTIRSFAELTRAERLVVGAPQVPVGRYTEEVLALAPAGFRSRVEERIVSRELNVRHVLARVRLGEADAGLVYRTDVAEGMPSIELPAEMQVMAKYPLAPTKGARHPEAARDFVAYVLSAEGQAVLERHGFRPP